MKKLFAVTTGAACVLALQGPAALGQARIHQKLEISVVVSGSSDNPQAIYRLLSSAPRLGAGQTVVQPNGDIDLRMIPPNPDFDDVTDITFKVTGTVSHGGRPYRIGFDRPAREAVALRKDGGGSTDKFVPSFPDPQERSKLLIIDQNDDSWIYFYCLNVTALGDPNVHARLDPSIVNR